MRQETVTVWNALMSSKDCSIEKSGETWDVIQGDQDVRDEVETLAFGSGLKLIETSESLFLFPISSDSPYLATLSKSLFPFLQNSKYMRRETNVLVNFIILKFMSLFYQSEGANYRTNRSYVTTKDLTSDIDKDLIGITKADAESVPGYLRAIASVWLNKGIAHTDALDEDGQPNPAKVGVGSSTKMGLVKGALSWLERQGCASHNPMDGWFPTERLDAILPIIFEDGRLDQLLDNVNLAAERAKDLPETDESHVTNRR